jgi:copper oxidase (laccase) domain-containing protein
MGLNEENIEISPSCTICTPQLFHSYRRDGNNSGRMMAAVSIVTQIGSQPSNRV